MKNQSLTKVATNPELEAIIRKKNDQINELGRKKGKHFGQNNQPAPIGDKLPPYIGDIKTAYEVAGADTRHWLQTGAHLPEGQIEADRAKEKCKALDTEIEKLEHQNKSDTYELQEHDTQSVSNRIYIALFLTGIILIGEIVFNTKAFEVIGESMLFALGISIAVSFAVYALSHFAPMLFKEIKTKFRRRMFIAIVLLVTSLAFYVLGVFRSNLLAQHDVSFSPGYFVVMNLFLFMVSVFISFYLLPSWEEIKGSIHNWRLQKAITKRTKSIASLKAQKEELMQYLLELAKKIVRINYYTEYTIKRLEKLYYESVEIFKSTNLTFRPDKKVPNCFHDQIPPPEMEHLITHQFLNNNNTDSQ